MSKNTSIEYLSERLAKDFLKVLSKLTDEQFIQAWSNIDVYELLGDAMDERNNTVSTKESIK